MTKETLKDLPLETLFDLMIKTLKELLDAIDKDKDNGITSRIKKKQVELLQRVIIAKIEDLQPVNQILSHLFSN